MLNPVQQRGRLSYTAYSQTPDDGKRYEYLGGEVYVSPTPQLGHQYASMELYSQLRAYFKTARAIALVFAAPTTVVLHDEPPVDAEIVVPDLLVVQDRSTMSRRGIEGPPLVIVELVSPSRPWLDRKTKRGRYAANGVPHYWIVDPDQKSMECYRLADGAYVLDASGADGEQLAVPAFAGLTIDLGELWLSLPGDA